MAWLFGADALADRLIADLPDDADGALPRAERELKVGELSNRIRALERQEEELVLREAANGRVVVRRAEMGANALLRSEEHTSELQSLMRISSAVFCLKK